MWNSSCGGLQEVLKVGGLCVRVWIGRGGGVALGELEPFPNSGCGYVLV